MMKHPLHTLFAHLSRGALLGITLLLSSSLLAAPDHRRDWQDHARGQADGDRQGSPWQEHGIRHPQLSDKWDKKKHRERYDSLSPEQRERIRKRRELFNSLPPEERQRIERAREKFRNLPPERRQELKEKWRKMSPEQRRQFHRSMEERKR